LIEKVNTEMKKNVLDNINEDYSQADFLIIENIIKTDKV